VVALHCKKFVEQNIAIKINSYLPYFDFYITFTAQGVLFDAKAPEKPVDLDVRTTLMDLIKIFVFGNRRSIKTMRGKGDIEVKINRNTLESTAQLVKNFDRYITTPYFFIAIVKKNQ
jgi:hypothetical protein